MKHGCTITLISLTTENVIEIFMKINSLSVLVTGGAGYIGSHTTHKLVENGHRVVVIDNLYSGHRWAIPPEVDFYEYDAGNLDIIRSLMNEYRFDAVIHFAGHIVVPESVSDPYKYYKNNVVNSLNLISCCQMSEIKHFIFSSSAAVYGNPSSIPVNERADTNPINPYGRTKLITEWNLMDMSLSATDRNPFSFVALRYFNVAGARLDAKLGQATPEATHLIKVACETAVGKRQSVSIYGTDYNTKDGTCIRDYIHVEDLADAHIKALDYLASGQKSVVLNCGYGEGFSVRDVLKSVSKVSGNNIKIMETVRRPGDPAQLIADNKKIKKTLDWIPRYNDIEVICETAFKWELNGNRPKQQ